MRRDLSIPMAEGEEDAVDKELSFLVRCAVHTHTICSQSGAQSILIQFVHMNELKIYIQGVFNWSSPKNHKFFFGK